MVLLTSGITLLILFSLGAFFSASETAMTALSRIDISVLKESSPLGAKVEKLLRHPDRLIASLLIGNNIANISASALVAYITDLYLDSIFIALSTFVLTLIIVIFCEIAPKQLALVYKRQVALLVIWPVIFFYYFFWPLLSLTLYFTKWAFPVLKRRTDVENLAESLDHMIELASKNGFINPYERDFINNVLDLNDKTARQIMTHRKDVFSISASARLMDVYPQMVENSYSRIPVYEEDPESIVGLLYLSDVQKFCLSQGQQALLSGLGAVEPNPEMSHSDDFGSDFAEVKVAQLMKPVAFLPDSVRVSDLFFQLKQHDSNLVIILDEYGGLAGVVSQEDVLEAVFGKLYDEDEKEEESTLDIQKEGDSFVFSGMLSIPQFEQFFDLEVQVEENSRLATMSGYICDLVGSIPEEDQVINVPEGRFQILASDGKRIVTLRFQPVREDNLPEDGEETETSGPEK